MEYLDFELEIQSGSGRDYPVAVLHSPAGEARTVMHFPFDQVALESRLDKLQIALLRSGGKQRSVPSDEEKAVQHFGQALFEALFTGEVRTRYDVSCERVAQKEQGLRLKLRIQAPELAALPWEFLYDPRQAEFVCLSRNTPVVRYLELQQPTLSLKVIPPLRILGIVASPSDLAPLDVTRERERVERAVAGLHTRGLVELTWLAGQTWRDLQREMRGGPWHILHFVGHGGFDAVRDEGFVCLTGEDGRTQYLQASQLGRLLADHRSLRLAVLNACEGARGGNSDVFSSTASILVRRGIPAVLAMQYGITDGAAIETARAFYEALADGLPVDAAVTEARKTVSLAVANTLEWGTLVLYMRATLGAIFELGQVPNSRPARIDSVAGLDKETALRLDHLYTQGLGAFWIEDWDRACRSFQSILDERSDYPNAAAKLEEAQRQRRLHGLFAEAMIAQEVGNLEAAQSALEIVVAEAGGFKDAATRLAVIKKQRQLADLYGEAHRLLQAEQWQAIINVFGQISAVDPHYGDPEDLLATAKRRVAELERMAQVDSTYRQAILELDAKQWEAAQRLLVVVQEQQSGYGDTERLLARASAEAAREKAEQIRQKQTAAAYEQALGLARARKWHQTLAKMQEIRQLDTSFADPEGVVARAQQAIAEEEAQTRRQTELAILYGEAVQLLREKKYQAALLKWSEVQARDARYPDRQRVYVTATRKLSALERRQAPGRRLPRWGLAVLAIVAMGALVSAIALLPRRVGHLAATGATPAPVAVVSAATPTLQPNSSATAIGVLPAAALAPRRNTPSLTATSTSLSTDTSAQAMQKAANLASPTATSTPLPTETHTSLPTATSTQSPTETSTPLPTNTNTPRPTSIPTATIDADPAVYDNFNNPAFDGSVRRDRWAADKPSSIVQQNGILEMTLTPAGDHLMLFAKQWPDSDLRTPIFFEAKVKLISDQYGGGPSLNIITRNDFGMLLYLEANEAAQGVTAGCSAGMGGLLGQLAVTAPDWHTLRFELDPTTMTVACYVDGQNIYTGVPAGSPGPERVTLLLRVNRYPSTQGDLIGAFDDVRIGPLQK